MSYTYYIINVLVVNVIYKGLKILALLGASRVHEGKNILSI